MGYCSAATECLRDKLPPKVFDFLRLFAHYVLPTMGTLVYGGVKLRKTLKAAKSQDVDATASNENGTQDEDTSKSRFIFTEFIQVIKQVVTRQEKTDDVIIQERCEEEEDEDRLFLMAILSEMKRVPDDYKLELKTDLMLAVRNWRRADKLPIQPNPLLGYDITKIHPTLHSQYFHWSNGGQSFSNKNVDRSYDSGIETVGTAISVNDLTTYE